MIQIQSYMGNYDVRFEKDFLFLEDLASKEEKLVVCDKKVYELYESVLNQHFAENELFLIDAIESNKTIETALKVCERATLFAAKKNLSLIAIGGGIIQDIAGFAANILYRGVELILVPTTLLSQADSCIGSKNSLNYQSYKNLLGTFYPPKQIYICFSFLKTLSDLDFNSGLGEIVKFNIMAGSETMEALAQKLEDLIERKTEVIEQFISNALNFKKPFIEQDEFDVKQRRLLNYAHTFGHAYEVISDYQIPHGHAVLLGTITANRISVGREILKEESALKIEKLCLRVYNAPALQCENTQLVIDIMKKDKKRQGNQMAAVLMQEDFSLHVVQDVVQEEVEEAVQYVRGLF